jgi:DNA modification methylase
MKALPDGCVDAVITDPPYGISFDRASWTDDPEQYERVISKLVSESSRLSVGACFVWQANPNADKWHRWFPSGYRIFAACKGFVQFRPTPVQWSWDAIIWWGDPKTDPSVYKKDFFVQSMAPFGAAREKIEHPCPKPIELMEYIVGLGTRAGETILDPFLGSGTTAVAAKKLGRHFLGFEISPDYCRIARERIALVEAQPSLFGTRAEQLELPR